MHECRWVDETFRVGLEIRSIDQIIAICDVDATHAYTGEHKTEGRCRRSSSPDPVVSCITQRADISQPGLTGSRPEWLTYHTHVGESGVYSTPVAPFLAFAMPEPRPWVLDPPSEDVMREKLWDMRQSPAAATKTLQ